MVGSESWAEAHTAGSRCISRTNFLRRPNTLTQHHVISDRTRWTVNGKDIYRKWQLIHFREHYLIDLQQHIDNVFIFQHQSASKYTNDHNNRYRSRYQQFAQRILNHVVELPQRSLKSFHWATKTCFTNLFEACLFAVCRILESSCETGDYNENYASINATLIS
jgi:hypothetical protein